ncbi:hypothetical protein [Streptomyces sp. HUAS TT20]|uniref:hypothetical protein n=1 Tax=Streptomyces sp. HUAS TT20 TaxID=3447509 RepID=UPI0021D831BD|nr:hypothetical protein [Streptomyces sp. HUAS 15-9]UXY32423.1 hypothetical protein N8I87_42030 [Streptomyces sp. HUAS 15-9]
MIREWRKGSIELVSGYTITDADGRSVGRAEGVDFALEGGFVNVRLPGAPIPSWSQLRPSV